jgi:small-conductance mechanosensitive channel
MPGKVTEITALVTRIRTEVGQITIPNNAISSGAAVITRINSPQEKFDTKIPYSEGDRIVTTYMSGGEGTVKEVTPLRTVILLDTGMEITFLNSTVFAGSIAVAKIAPGKPAAK